MLVIDDSKFPLVWLNQVNNTEGAYNHNLSIEESFSQLEMLFERKVPFVLISENDYANDKDHEHPKEEKMIIATWMKKNKPNVRKYIIAQIQVIPKERQTMLLKAFSKTFSKFWGFPLIIATNKNSAIEKAHELLERS